MTMCFEAVTQGFNSQRCGKNYPLLERALITRSRSSIFHFGFLSTTASV